jgi:hypothetical protein
MFFISHRGNLQGTEQHRENTERQIVRCINLGFDVEIDLWYLNNTYWLGHDEPSYKTSRDFLFRHKEKLWCHAKNHKAFFNLLKDNLHCFWHDDDTYTLTSKSIIWAYPGSKLNNRCICVMPEKSTPKKLNKVLGICSDHIIKYKDLIL